MPDVSIRCTGLSKRYTIGSGARYKTLRESLMGIAGKRPPKQTLWALKDVSFEVREGAVLGLVGRNGAGKSTLLKVLSRITEPTEGRVEFVGRVGSLLEVGTGFHPELTGRENVYLNGSILGMKRREIAERFDEIVAFAEVEAFLDTPVKRYSSGMYVRLAFAVAAHLEPEILLVDEVLAVGDAAFQKKCLGKMGEVARHGRTVVFVSHNMAAVQQLTQTALWLDGGRVVEHGPTRDVVQNYLASLQTRAGTSVEVDDAMRPFSELGRAVEFVRVSLLDRATTLVPADEPIVLGTTLRAQESVERFRIGVTITRADGVAVGNVFSADALSIGAGETQTFRVHLRDLRLAPGLYFFSLGVGTGDQLTERREFDVVRDVLAFEILSGSADIAGEWHAEWGAIRFPTPEVERAR